MFQAPQRPLDERPLDFDIVLGQLYCRVRDIFYTARRRLSVITDIGSPPKLRFAAVQPVAGIPLLSPGTRRFWISSGIYRLNPPVQDLPATLLRNSLPSQWRDLTLGIGGVCQNARQERTIRRDICSRHPRRGEPLFKIGANLAPVHVSGLLHTSTAASIESTILPLTPSVTTSGTDPFGQAITGVPADIASIMTSPKGSGQSIGNNSARALPRNSHFWVSLISPMNSMRGWSRSGLISVSKYSRSTASTFAASFKGIPARLAISIARSGRFSGEMCLVARFSYCPRIILIPASDSTVCDRTLDLQRHVDYIVGRHVEQKLAEIGEVEGPGKQLSAAEWKHSSQQRAGMRPSHSARGTRSSPTRSANRSLSAIEPVSAPPKWKLKNGDQRPAPKIRPARTEMAQIAGQRQGHANLTRGNVADSHTPGNNTPETRLPG